MIFLQPWAWGLLVLAVGVTVLYFLRRREEPLRVSAIWLWPQESERPRSALSFLWTNIGLLLLQLAALLGLVFALAMPLLSQETVVGGQIAILIDSSASMQAREGAATRYERAIALATEQIERLRPGKIVIIQAQREPHLLVPLSADRAAAIRALQRSQPSWQSDGDWSALVQLLFSQGELSQFREIIYISDRPPQELERVRWLRVGSSVSNLALTGFAARPLPEAHSRIALWGRVENLSGQPLAGQIKIFAEEKEIFRQSISLEPQSARDLETVSPAARRFVAQLEIDDAFAPDNRRYFLLPAHRTLRILWLGERNFFLERALGLYAEPRFEFIATLTSSPSPLEGRGEREDFESYDLVVANNILLPSLRSGRWLLINSALDPLIKIAGDLSVNEPVRLLDATHPLLEHVQIAHLQPLRLRDASLSSSVRPLAVAHNLPLIAVHSSGTLRLLYMGTSLQESALVLTPSFPVFIQNALRWLLPEAEPALEDQYVSSIAPTPGFQDDRAINIDPRESLINLSVELSEQHLAASTDELIRAQTTIWWYGAWAALAFLGLEIVLYTSGRSFFSVARRNRQKRGDK